jgi:ABC-type multidrug transport system fused ATPase/permease subunit
MQQRLDVGGVIGRVWSIYVDQASVLMPAAAVVFVIEGIVAALLAASGSLVGLLLAEIIAIVASILFTGMVVELVADVQDGRRDASAAQLVRAVTPVLWQLIIVGFVAGIGIVIGFVLIVVPGLILITIWSVFVPVIVLERAPGFSSLGRSRDLVRGNGWQVFGVLFVLFVLVGVVTTVLDGAAASASTGAGIVVRVVLGVLTAPFGALAAAVLYFDLRAASGEATSPTPGGPTPGAPPPDEPPTPGAPSAGGDGSAFRF